MNFIMKKSGIFIKWFLHCIDLTNFDADIVKDQYGQNITLDANANLKMMNDWFNCHRELCENQKIRSRDSDVAVVISHDLGSKSSFATSSGIQLWDSTVFVKQDFAFQNFEIMHAIGHMLGCTHEKESGEQNLVSAVGSQLNGTF